MMRKLTIQLPDETAATFEVKPVIVMFPTDREGYLGFLDAAQNISGGLQASTSVLAKLRVLDGLTIEAIEGIEVLSNITRHLVEFEAVLQVFFSPSVAIEYRTGKGVTLQ